jgi:hypothetical protein
MPDGKVCFLQSTNKVVLVCLQKQHHGRFVIGDTKTVHTKAGMYLPFQCCKLQNTLFVFGGPFSGNQDSRLPLVTDENKTSTGESKTRAIVTLAN